MPLWNTLAVKICDRNTPDPCQQLEWKYRHLRTPGSLIDCKLAMCISAHMFKAHLVMEGNHEILKSLAPLEDMSLCHLSFLESKASFSARGENGPWWTRRASGKVWNHFEWEKGQRCELWAISHPVVWSKCPISKVLPDLYYFLYFIWAGTPFWIDYWSSWHALQQWQMGGYVSSHRSVRIREMARI